MLPNPLGREDGLVNPIPDSQQTARRTYDARELEPRFDEAQLFIADFLAPADVAIRFQHRRRVRGLLRQHVADELQVAVLIAHRAEEERRDSLLDVFLGPGLERLL